MADPCPNCSLTTHRKCCAYCGAVMSARRRRGSDYCSAKCEDDQIHANNVSDAIERGEPTHAFVKKPT